MMPRKKKVEPKIEPPEISCDRCIAPGTCCKAIQLFTQEGVEITHPLGTTLEKLRESLRANYLPFEPLRRLKILANSDESEKEAWLYSCPKLGDDGRCTIYETRPRLCRTYEPGCDHMCVHMRKDDGFPVIPQLPVIA
jgi:Fe-S-cluster containining protein